MVYYFMIQLSLWAHLMPRLRSGAESPMCEEGNFPPLTNKTFTPKSTAETAVIAMLSMINFILTHGF